MSQGVMRSPSFDLAFIWVPFGIALCAGALCEALNLPMVLLVLTTWVFGYSHATAMLTRLYFDSETRNRHWFLAWILPVICVALVVTLQKINPMLVPAAFLLSRFFHYTRQSHGFAKILGRHHASGFSHFLLIFAVPVIFVLPYVQTSQLFFDTGENLMPLKSFAPIWFAPALTAIAALWIFTCYRRANETGEKNYHLYVFTHVAVFAIGYLSFNNVGSGIFVLGMWHAIQYLMFFWHHGNRGSARSNDFYAKVFSAKNLPLAVFLLAIATLAMYGSIKVADRFWLLNLTFIGTMSINFHHYITEAIIWRR